MEKKFIDIKLVKAIAISYTIIQDNMDCVKNLKEYKFMKAFNFEMPTYFSATSRNFK